MQTNGIDSLIQAHPNRVLVQPRMGFGGRSRMQSGLQATRACGAPVVGTITVDAMTRQGLVDEATAALRRGESLNGYPIASYSDDENRALLAGVRDDAFPVQVRHGSPLPMHVFRAAARAGIDSIEGGPISYCLPYSRVPLTRAIAAWREAIRFWAEAAPSLTGRQTHCESFGGCMMGQLCPPSLLVVLSVLEGRFFADLGLRSLSVSYAQGTNDAQDIGALLALRDLAGRYLADTRWHLVQYTWMGVFPSTRAGALALMRNSARIAARGGADRLIVKTVAEAHGIPSIDDNRAALALSRREADAERGLHAVEPGAGPAESERAAHGRDPHETVTVGATAGEVQAWREEIAEEATALIDAVLSLSPDLGDAFAQAFRRGWLDVPFCLHQDNRNRARARLDAATGAVRWGQAGRLALPRRDRSARSNKAITAAGLLRALDYNRRRYDGGGRLRNAAVA